MKITTFLVCAASVCVVRIAAAQPAEPTPAAPPSTEPRLELTPLGYVEAYYAWNFNRPANHITNFRGFDNRHDTFTLENVALGVNAQYERVGARIVAQVGATPSTYYLAEPAFAGTGAANASSGELWKYLQEAFVTYKADVGRGLLLQLGLCLSPVGYEGMAIKDNWNWSRSNLFFGFPFYHTGLRATYQWSDELSTTFSVFNGWNTVVDNNDEKSVEGEITYKLPDKLMVRALYFGGVERPLGARPEGPGWRSTFDFIGQYDATTYLSFAGQADYGFEPTRMGTASWAAGALYARVKPVDRVYIALRGDRFHENLATDAMRSSAPIFYNGAEWVTSQTATLDVRPHDNLSVRLEYRHDIAEIPLFFAGDDIPGDGTTTPFVANARTQDTLTLGATAWFQ